MTFEDKVACIGSGLIILAMLILMYIFREGM